MSAEERLPPTRRRGAGPPAASLLGRVTGYWISQAVYVAAKLAIADLLVDGPVHCDDLAAATETHAPSLRRVLRALAGIGIFTEASPGAFALTPQADLLRTGTSDSLRAFAILYNEELYRAWGDLLHSVRTGTPAFEHQFGMPFYYYAAQHPDLDRLFNEAMIGYTTTVADAVVAAYDWSPFRTVVDVGGGYGALMAAILRRYPAARGIVFDQPHVVADIETFLTAAGVAERFTVVGGDFFGAVPAGGDAYLLAQILHNWDDARGTAILRQCRRAMPSHGKLLVVELVMPESEEPSAATWVDLNMLVSTSGRERTAEEYDTLFRTAGFALTRVVLTSAGPSVVEGVPV